MSTSKLKITDPVKMRTVIRHCGARRYAEGANKMPVGNFGLYGVEENTHNPIYFWTVGSPFSFRWGFERNRSWASRRMRSVMRKERATIENQRINCPN